MNNCLGGIGHFCMKNIFRIYTQTLAYGNRKENGRVPSRFVETRYFQSEEQLASHARRSPKEICGAARYHPSQTISARISSTAKLFAEDSEKHGRLTGKTRISLCELSPMKIREDTVQRETRETCVERGTRGRERSLCRGEIVKAAIEFAVKWLSVGMQHVYCKVEIYVTQTDNHFTATAS